MKFLYQIFISLFTFGFKIFAYFNQKAKKGALGRKESFSIIYQTIKNQEVIWMHAASLGEYEQGLQVLEKMKTNFPEYKILITFFSSSGYENVVNKNHIADAICYLPFDNKNEIKNFISVFKPKIFILVKYDFWYHLLEELYHNKTKIFVISALFYPRQIFFKPYGKWFARELKKNINWTFHQNKQSFELGKKIELVKASISGDTRFDRVKNRQAQKINIDFIESFKGQKDLILFGSSWEQEEKIAQLIGQQNKNIKIIIAPHDLKRLPQIKKNFPNSIFYSEFEKKYNSQNVMIIDSIGLLSNLYFYCDIAVVGGGFHSHGLHNILEAATFGKPTLFGKHYKKNPEADLLIKEGGAKAFENEKTTSEFIFKLINNSDLRKKMSENAFHFIQKQPNSTEIILEKIKDFF